MNKVFIGQTTNRVKNYCADSYYNNILSLSYPNKEYYYVDNSENESYSLYLRAKFGIEVDWFNPSGMRNTDYMRESLNVLREKFLESDCDYWFSCEVDLYPPSYIIDWLISYELPIVTCPYFIAEGKYSQLCKTHIEKGWGQKANININQYESFVQYNGSLQQVQMVGLGVALIHRSVIEQIGFITGLKDTAHADTYFFFDTWDKGIPVYSDNSFLISHDNKDWSKNVMDWQVQKINNGRN